MVITPSCVLLFLCLALLFCADLATVSAAEPVLPMDLKVKADAALAKAVAWLRHQEVAAGTAEGSLIAYALLKAQVPPEERIIALQLEGVLKKMDRGCYRDDQNPRHHIYEAGCDAMLLEAADPVQYQPQLTEIRDYLLRRQQSTGAWYYPTPPPPNPAGDTSITQYGVLGLWAVQRAHLDVPREVWSNAAKYHSSTQRSDGGFVYHPYDKSGTGSGGSTGSMSAAGLGSTLVVQLMLTGLQQSPNSPSQSLQRRFGVLEQLQDRQAAAIKAAAPRGNSEPLISRDAVKKVVSDGEKAVSRLFEEALKGPHPVYFLYGCERAGALLNTDRLGDVLWYERGAEFLTTNQFAEGRWRTTGGYDDRVNTALAILFLSRATKSLVKPRQSPRPVGGGLLVGARGLPDDLNQVTLEDGSVKARVPKSDVDRLLAELEQPGDAKLTEEAPRVIEQIDLDHPEAYIGQTDRLRSLRTHPQAEVRQLVAWALGRSGQLSEAPLLIALLNDNDPIVAWEASLSLCVLSRLPMGITPAGAKAPLPVEPPETSEMQASPELIDWRKRSTQAWDAWYQQVRAYDERDDRRQIRSR